MTILFSDIRGFTAFCEEKDPGLVVDLLNEYMGGMVKIIVNEGGKPSREIEVESKEWLYSMEADVVAANVSKGQAPSPAMTWMKSIALNRSEFICSTVVLASAPEYAGPSFSAPPCSRPSTG